MKATVQINYKAWEAPTLYVFCIDFDVIPHQNDTLEIEYKGKIIQASVYNVTQRLTVNPDSNSKPKFFIRAFQTRECNVENRHFLD